MEGKKDNLEEAIISETIGSNTIVTSVEEIVKENNKNSAISDNLSNELSILKNIKFNKWF